MKMSQWRRAVENRCVFSARVKALSDRSGDRSAGGRRFHVAVRWLQNFVVQSISISNPLMATSMSVNKKIYIQCWSLVNNQGVLEGDCYEVE